MQAAPLAGSHFVPYKYVIHCLVSLRYLVLQLMFVSLCISPNLGDLFGRYYKRWESHITPAVFGAHYAIAASTAFRSPSTSTIEYSASTIITGSLNVEVVTLIRHVFRLLYYFDHEASLIQANLEICWVSKIF